MSSNDLHHVKFTMFSYLLAVAALSVSAVDMPDKWVRYVEATGSQYVDTGIVGRPGTKVECRVEWMAFSDSAFLASRKDGGDTRLYFCTCLNADGEMYTAQGTYEKISWWGGYNCRFEPNRVYTYVSEFTTPDADGVSTNVVVVDGLGVWTKAGKAVDTGVNLYAFACNKANAANANSKTRCYGLKIWQDGTLVRDFRPCMEDGRAALYDAKNQKIYFSASKTDLVCDENSEVPDEFIEYVDSQGEGVFKLSEQTPAYVDTGVIGKSGTKMAGEFALLESADKGLLGSRNGNTRFYLLQSYNSKITCGYGGHKENSFLCTLGKKYYCETELNAGSQVQKIAADGVTNTVYSATDSTEINTGYPIYLFTCNQTGTPTWFGRARTYGFKMWQDGELVRDFRPCLKNGVAGLYDAVSKRIFYSSATPLVFDNRKRVDRREVVLVDYIESDGCTTLDTGVPAKSGLRAKGDMSWVDLRPLNYEERRYLENTAAVYYRHKRAYLGGGFFGSTYRNFNMIQTRDQYLMAGYGSLETTPQLPGGGNVVQPIGERQSFDITFANGSQTILWNGVNVLDETVEEDFDTGDTLHLFSSSHQRYRSSARCYGLEIWQDGERVRNFKPCVYEGKGMLYDEETQSVYRPSPDIPLSRVGSYLIDENDKPEVRLEYVESDGTLFVDTGVIGRPGTAAQIGVAFMESADTSLLESRKGDTRYYLLHNGGGNHLMIGYGAWYYLPATLGPVTKTASEAYTMTVGERLNVSSSLASGAQAVSVNGTQLLSDSLTDATDTGLNLYVFACNKDGAPGWPSKAKLYGLKICQDGELVRNFKPVRLSNGLVALWDKVQKKAYLPKLVGQSALQRTFDRFGPEVGPVDPGSAILVR